MADDVRCPSCGRPTPLAPFCTHCGAVIPESARPRGLDRDELEERIRQRRGADPFRRGADAVPGAFIPDPLDRMARREPADAEEAATGHVDHLGEVPAASAWPSRDLEEPATRAWSDTRPSEPAPRTADPEPTPPRGATRVTRAELPASPVDRGPAIVPPLAAQSRDVRPEPPPPEPAAAVRPGDESADRGYPRYAAGGAADGGYDGTGDDDGYDGDDGYDDPPRRSGLVPVLGLLVLGVAALLGGAALFAVMNAGPGTAQGSPTPTAAASVSAGETASPSTEASGSPSESPGASAPASPSAAADSFTARAEPCATNQMTFTGCAADGSTISGSQIWIWVGFKNGQSVDIIGTTLLDRADGSTVADGSIPLSALSGCTPSKSCTGYVQFRFSSLAPGDYDVKVTRNDTEVATTAFTVS